MPKTLYQLQSALVKTRQALAEVATELAEYERASELQHSRTRKADKLWQKAHSKPNVMPDLGELVEWLINRYDAHKIAHRYLSKMRLSAFMQLAQIFNFKHPKHIHDWDALTKAARNYKKQRRAK